LHLLAIDLPQPVGRSIGFDPRGIDGHPPQPRHPRPPRRSQHLPKQLIQRSSMPSQELAQRLVVRPRSCRQKPEAEIFLNPLLQLPGRAHVHRHGVQPHLQHHPRVIRFLSLFAVLPIEWAQILLLDHRVNGKAQVPGGQFIPHVSWQQLRLLRLIREKVRHTSSSFISLTFSSPKL
jgi:hypothetical protein